MAVHTELCVCLACEQDRVTETHQEFRDVVGHWQSGVITDAEFGNMIARVARNAPSRLVAGIIDPATGLRYTFDVWR